MVGLFPFAAVDPVFQNIVGRPKKCTYDLFRINLPLIHRVVEQFLFIIAFGPMFSWALLGQSDRTSIPRAYDVKLIRDFERGSSTGVFAASFFDAVAQSCLEL